MPDRRRAEKRGRRAEALAVVWLRVHGWRMLARNVRTPRGEIDVIVRRGKVLAFIEIKRRGTLDEARAAIRPAQQARIRAAAEIWLAGRPDLAACDMRFDALLLVPRRWPLHIREAF